ncbi:hypothetical protein HaLaN_30777 [Haematococcus lacustris]|uniref:Uncharacterized protein n=1 Tax=Haematococcus lacustris TaxID=44745 RepID=A0A6A0AIH7_HAELA|nr:hypothetical protein HaLaN_30777 [Haematococcus lacustris]
MLATELGTQSWTNAHHVTTPIKPPRKEHLTLRRAWHANGSAVRNGPFKCCFVTPTTQDAEFSAALHCVGRVSSSVKPSGCR